MPKSLPIQYVETRGEQDVFLKEGGGDNKLPKWATPEAIDRNVETLSKTISRLESIFNERENDVESSLPLITVATLHEKATAKSYRANVREVFDERKKRNIIGVASPTELIVKIDNKDALYRLSRFYRKDSIENLGTIKKIGVAAIVNLSLFQPEIEDDLTGHLLKVRLVDYKDFQLNERSERFFLDRCHELRLNAKKIDYTCDIRLYSIDQSTDDDAIRSLTTMDGIISVKKMPYIEISTSPNLDNTKLDVKSPKEGESYPLVGLLDSGVADIPHLSQWLQCDDNIASFAENDINRRHGTAVAGVLNYGDELEQAKWTSCSPMKIASCIVNTDTYSIKVSESELIENIKAAVKAHSEVKVWNLSQGSNVQVKDDDFSEFAITLDKIQKDYNILICKSAGNVDLRKPEDDRITQGADSVLSIVVGSIANRCEKEGDVGVGIRSSFSRKGPGPEFLVKPDLVHYGGNTFTKIHSFSEIGYESSAFMGTSFSTPRVSALAANLAHRISEPFDPTLIKALLIHSACYQYDVGDIDSRSLLYEQGYGLPSSLDNILKNDQDEFTMIWQPPFKEGDAQIQDIPFPISMVDDEGLFYGDITVTVVADPILKPSEGTEYCQSDIEVLLQTYDDTIYVPLGAAGTPKRYRNANRLHNPQNILVKSLYSKKSLKASDMEERTLIESDFKYQPIKKYHVNLEKMTPAKRRLYLSSDKRWGLSVKALYRDAVAVDLDYDGEREITHATIIITIRDPKHKGLAYNECFTSLEQHNFHHTNIEIAQRIDITNK